MPAGTPPDIIDRLNIGINKALNAPDAKKRLLEAAGIEAAPSSPQNSAPTSVDAETRKWAKVVKDAGAKVD